MMENESLHVQAWEKADRDFHVTMVSHCGSLQLVRYHASVIELYMRYQSTGFAPPTFSWTSICGRASKIT